MKKDFIQTLLEGLRPFLEKLVEQVPTLKKIGLDPDKLLPAPEGIEETVKKSGPKKKKKEDAAEMSDEDNELESEGTASAEVAEDATDPAMVLSDLEDDEAEVDDDDYDEEEEYEDDDEEDEEDDEEEDEEDDEEDDSPTLIEKLTSIIKPGAKGDDEGEKKKPNLKIIIGAIALMALLLMDGDEKETKKEQVSPKPKKPSNRIAAPQKDEVAKPKQEVKKVQDGTTEVKEAAKPKDLPEKKIPKEPEAIKVAPAKPEKKPAPEPMPKIEAKKEESAKDTITTNIDSLLDEPKKEVKPVAPKQDIDMTEIDLGDIDFGEAIDSDQKPEITKEEVKAPEEQSEPDVASKLLDKLSNEVKEKRKTPMEEGPVFYIKPPNYERSGRGLVYSCSGQHWACIDGFSYGVCEKNFRWHSNQNTKPECFPSEVYLTNKDCINAQMMKINSAADTKFCGSFTE
jgi:hypothetical protein